MGLQDWTAWASGRCHARQILPGSDAEFLRTLLVFLSSGDQNPKKSNLQEELFWLMVLEIVVYSPWWGRTISWYGIWWKGCLSHGGQEIERDRNGPGMKYIPKGRAPPPYPGSTFSSEVLMFLWPPQWHSQLGTKWSIHELVGHVPSAKSSRNIYLTEMLRKGPLVPWNHHLFLPLF